MNFLILLPLVFLSARSLAFDGDNTGSISSQICDACDAAVLKFEDNLPEIVGQLIQVCANLPEPLRSMCDKELDEIITKIATADITPSEICGLLPFCPESTVEIQSMGSIANKVCDACDAIVLKFEDNLPEIVSQLIKVCANLPDPLRSLCDKELDEIITKIASADITPSQICGLLPFCPESTVEKQVKSGFLSHRSQNTLGCGLCEAGVAVLQQELASVAVEEKVETAVLDVCNEIEAGIDRLICKSLVAGNFPKLWQKLLAALDGKRICTELKLCNAALEDLTGLGCSFCKDVFVWFQIEILTDANENSILAQMDKECNDMPNLDYAQKCTETLDKYGKQIFQKVIEILSPDSICQIGHACPASFAKAGNQ